MYSVFSNHLFQRRAAIESAKQRKMVPANPTSILEELRELKHCDYLPDILLDDTLNNKIAEQSLYKITTQPDVRRVVTWITKNIIWDFNKDCQETRWVKIRIATDMLNKCVYNGALDKCEGIYMHDNLVKNLTDIMNDIYDEQMPFLATALGVVVRSTVATTADICYRSAHLNNCLNFVSIMIESPRITESEINLIKKAQEGDIPSFNRLYYKYRTFVVNVLLNYLKDKDESRDLANVVFLKVHDKLSTFRAYDTFGGWLRRIANNTAIDYLRSRRNSDIVMGDKDVRLTSADSITSDETDLVNQLTCEKVYEFIDTLPKTTRVIMNLFYVENLPIDDISKRLHIPAGTIKSTLSRTRKVIKNKFKNELNV